MTRSTSAKVLSVLLVFAMLSFLSTGAFAGTVNSNQASVALNVTISESITVSVSPATVNFNDPGVGNTNGDNPVSVTTSWLLSSGHSSLTLYTYFANGAAAVTGTAGSIPASAFSYYVNGGGQQSYQTSLVAFTGIGGSVFTIANPAAGSGSRTDSVALQLTNNGSITPGTYSGTVFFQAQAL